RNATVGCVVGKITSFATPVGSIAVSATNGSTTRNAVTRPDGGYRLTNLAAGTWTVSVSLFGQAPVSRVVTVLPGVDNFGASFAFPIGVVYGDVDQSGAVDLRDAIGALRMLTGVDPLSTDKITRADIAPW